MSYNGFDYPKRDNNMLKPLERYPLICPKCKWKGTTTSRICPKCKDAVLIKRSELLHG